jgi:hypothetical protein
MITDLSPVWVDPEAALRLLPDGSPKKMTVLLNTRRVETAHQYVQRATCVARMGYQTRNTGDLPVGEEGARERHHKWVRAVWTDFFDAEDEDDRILPEDLGDRVHYLIIHRRSMPDGDFAAAVRLLHATFPWLVVVVTTGHEEADENVSAAFGEPIRPQPPITAAKEQTAYLCNKRLRALLTDY